MTSRDRMAAAMRHRVTSRPPVMCQLSLGHYFLNAGLDPLDVWHDSEAFASALVRLRHRYGFDGILVNLPGRDPEWRRQVVRVEAVGADRHVVWRDGRVTVVPPDDNPHVYATDRVTRPHPAFEELDPERLRYVEPHDIAGPSYPTAWGFGTEPAPLDDFFPPWHWDTLRLVRKAAPDVSVHAEVFSPFTQLLELLDYAPALMALLDDPGKVGACLEALTDGTIELMTGHARAGADAILISSAFAGAGFISRAHYVEFVLPFERRAIEAFHAGFPDVPVYTHTCGRISDRLDLMEATGTDGIDALDPPPLGDVRLAEARRRVGDRLFIKGNVDPVNTVLHGAPAAVLADARRRVAAAGPGGGYILSTACSVSPHTPPENILQIRAAADLGPYPEALG